MYNHSLKRPEKTTARRLACERRWSQPHKAALFLTVPKVPDIKLALENGTINKSTTIIVVNDNPKICSSVRQSLGRMGFKSYHVIDGKLQDSIDQIEALNVQIDYAFLDFCGGITFALCVMLHRMRGIFADRTRIAMTICAKVRQRAFIDDYERAFGNHLPSAVTGVFATPLASSWVTDLVTGAFDTARAKYRWFDGLRLSAASCKTADIRRMERSNVVSNFVWQVAAVWGALSNYRLNFTDSHIYHEQRQGATSMGFVQFDMFQTRDDHNRWEMVKSVVGINAAHKAWTTRRDNELTPAQRAWVTRRERYGKTGIGK